METTKKTLAELDFYYDEHLWLYLFPIYVTYKQKSTSRRFEIVTFFTQKDAENYFYNIEKEIGITYMIEKLEMKLGVVLSELNLKTKLSKKNLQQEISFEQLNSIPLVNELGLWCDDLEHFYDTEYYCYLYDYTERENQSFSHPVFSNIEVKIIKK